MKMLIAYDGTINARTALEYGLTKLRESGGSATVLHVFHAEMFIDYGAGPNAEALARSEAKRHVEGARRIVEEKGAGLSVKIEEREGVPEDEIIGLAREAGIDMILAPPGFKSVAKKAPCPVIVIPGAILVPVDNSAPSQAALGRIIGEAKATGSRVVLVGIVPVHMYGYSEKDEVKKIEKETAGSVREIEKVLAAEGIKTAVAMRSGYPDEEILKAVEEFSASMVVLPTAEDVPSEISKAASIIREEADRLKKPVLLMPAAEA
jgi:nucleotide-binding universal stress UspA family protein